MTLYCTHPSAKQIKTGNHWKEFPLYECDVCGAILDATSVPKNIKLTGYLS